MLSGCGVSQSPIGAHYTTYSTPGPSNALAVTRAATLSRGWLSPEAKSVEPLIYVADDNRIWIFPEDGARDRPSPIGLITDGVTSAYGLFVDRHRNLYVANWHDKNVEMYRPGSLTPYRVYTDSLTAPLYEVVNRQGDLFVGNGGGGTVTEFLAGSTKAHRVVQTDGNEADGMDIDGFGNLYVAYRNGYSNAGVDRFSPDLRYRRNLGISLVQPQGLLVTHSGDILVVETNYSNAVDEFLPGQKTPKLRLVPPEVLTELALDHQDHKIFASSLANAVYAAAFPLRADDSFNLVLALQLYSSASVQGLALSNGQRF